MNAPAASASSAFVLVHGAWHGAWCWRRVLPLLREAGVPAHAVTLTGVGERAHLLSPSVDLHTHIQDVVGLIEAEELQRVVLVGHSYAGHLITCVADRLQRSAPGLLRHLVYLDASVPRPGESWSSPHPEATRQGRIEAARSSGGLSFPPPDAQVWPGRRVLVLVDAVAWPAAWAAFIISPRVSFCPSAEVRPIRRISVDSSPTAFSASTINW